MTTDPPRPGQGPESSPIDLPVDLHTLARQAARQFADCFGRPPQWMAAAPGRVNLIGEHTDYNDGFVLPMAIQRYVVLAAAPGPNDEKVIRVHSRAVGQTKTIAVTEQGIQRDSDWTNYVRGVFAGCLAEGMRTGPLDMLVEANVPLGGGLSSSAALEVATATLIEQVTGRRLDPIEKALLCQRAEHEYAGVPCGIMDQFTSVLGQADHLMLLDCRSRQTRMVPLADPDVSVLIINTNVKHELTGGEYAQRRQQCEEAARALGVPALRDATLQQLEAARPQLSDAHYRRARHVIGENQRTCQAAEALQAGRWDQVGQLMYASHASLRDDYEVSCRELDLLVALAGQLGEARGVIGSRMTGGGFGGCTVSLVRTGAVTAVAQSLAADYQEQTGIQPSLFVSRPARGAHPLDPAALG